MAIIKSNLVFYQVYLAVFLAAFVTSWAQDVLINPSQLKMFVDELPDMPRIKGYDVVNGVPVPKSLNIGMFSKPWKFHRDLPMSQVFAYGTSTNTATVPGPTIEALHGIDTYITWENYLPQSHILPWDPTIPTAIPSSRKGVPTVVHLHGGIDEPQSDGHPEAWFTAGYAEKGRTWTNKKYHYRNVQQPGNLMYHDHATGLTRVNLLAGLLGAYIIRQPNIEVPLGLPYGDEFDKPLIVFDRNFYANGSIYMNKTGNNPTIHPQWQPEYFGDIIVVNGKAWPYMTVQRKAYRFRIINLSNARFYKFYLTNGLGFVHVGSDSAYHERPVMLSHIILSPAESADVVIDFSKSKSNSTILANDAPYPYPSGSTVNQYNSQVMKFIISPYGEDKWQSPKQLIKYPSGDPSSAALTRYISMDEYTSSTGQPTHLLINGKTFTDPVTETPKVGTTEIWEVINLTQDTHPLHIHFALFMAIEQTELVNLNEFRTCMEKNNDAVKCQIDEHAIGKKVAVPAHEQGWKNVFKMPPGYVTKIVVRFSLINSNNPYPFDATAEPGYVYHCHMLDHEDNVKIRPLKLIK